jgi:dihydrofolate reductase
VRKLTAFMFVTVDGYFEGPNPWSIDWHNVDEEFNEFATRQLDANDCLVFGRTTYLGMAQYWSSPEALQTDGDVATRMNSMPKVVVSKTLTPEEVRWSNTRLVHEMDELASIKQQSGKGLLLLGSSVLTASALDAGLVDELRVMVNPILLGQGNSFAQNPGHPHPLQLLSTRQFRNGNVLLNYAPRGG